MDCGLGPLYPIVRSIPNRYSHTPMRNPVDRAIKAMTFGAGLVGLLVLTVFQLL